MDELDRDRSFANSRCNSLHRSVAHIPDCKDTGNVGFEQEGIALERPTFGMLSVTNQIGTGQQKTALITLHEVSEPVGARQRSNKNENCTRRYTFHFVGVRAED